MDERQQDLLYSITCHVLHIRLVCDLKRDTVINPLIAHMSPNLGGTGDTPFMAGEEEEEARRPASATAPAVSFLRFLSCQSFVQLLSDIFAMRQPEARAGAHSEVLHLIRGDTVRQNKLTYTQEELRTARFYSLPPPLHQPLPRAPPSDIRQEGKGHGMRLVHQSASWDFWAGNTPPFCVM